MNIENEHFKSKIFSKKIYYVLVLILFLTITLFLVSCSSNSYISNFDNFSFNYDKNTNATLITWKITLFNDNYLTLKSEKFYLNLYHDDTLLKENGYILCDYIVNPGETITRTVSFYYKGDANKAVFSSFDIVEYDTLWNTYEGWFIGAITILVTDSDLSDVWEFLTDSGWTWLIVFIPLLITLITSGVIAPNGQYGPLIICASAIGILIVSCLIFHFILFLIMIIFDLCDTKKVEEKFLNIDPYSNEINQLSKEDLIDYCEFKNILENNVRFNFYTKAQIVDWLKKWFSGEDIEWKMNYDLRFLNRNQLINYCNRIDAFYNDNMNNLELACEIADVDYDDGIGILNFLTINELKKICKSCDILNYEDLNRNEIIDLIKNSNLEEFELDFDEEILWLENSESDSDSKKSSKSKKEKPISSIETSSDITFKDIAGLDNVKKAFNEKIILPMKHANLYKNFNKKTGGGIILFGLPGTGKTLFAEAVANEIDAEYFSIKCSDIKSKWIGESEERIKKLFKEARKAKRAIIFMDEFEAIGRKRTENDIESQNIVPEILAQMQGFGSDNNNILVIAATNRPWDIDSALLRPGRFDEKIYVPLPDKTARKEIFKIKLKNVPFENLDFDYLASITNDCNGSDISYFCEKLKMSAINRSIDLGKEQKINNIDVEKVKKEFRSSVNFDDLEEMENFLNN